MRWEKRFVIWLRRLSSAEGSSSTTSSGTWFERGDCAVSTGLGEAVEFGGRRVFESSAYRRVWERTLHCRQVGARKEGRLGTRKDREAGEEVIDSKTSLGTDRAKGCIARLYRC